MTNQSRSKYADSHSESNIVDSFIAWDLLQSPQILKFTVKMSVCQSKTQLLIFANLQDKSPQRNFTSKSSNIKIKAFSPCRPVHSLQSAMCKTCRDCKAFSACWVQSAKTPTERSWVLEHWQESCLLFSQLLRLLESYQASGGQSLEWCKSSLKVKTSLCQQKGQSLCC